MPERASWEGPERLLAGSDRPRPLPPALRSRLAEALMAGAGGRPLSQSARSRLQGRLVARQRLRKWGALGTLAVAAAAVVVVVAFASPGRQGPPVAAPQAARPPQAARSSALRAPKSPSQLSPHPISAAVVSVTPRQGPAKGGNWVVVRGNGVGMAGKVYFGEEPALRVEHVSASEVRALAPAHAPGTVSVSVGSPAGAPREASPARPEASPARPEPLPHEPSAFGGSARPVAGASYTFKG